MNNQHILLMAALGLALSPLNTRGADGQLPSQSEETQEPRGKSQPPKEKWIKSLTNVRKKLMNADAKESCKLIDEVIASLYRSERLSDSDAVGYGKRLRSHSDDLIRRGDFETAFTLIRALLLMGMDSEKWPGSDGPIHPPRSGGKPGPGGMVLYFPFDQQAANGVVKDESGTGNDGRVEGAQWVPEGRIGGAYRFKITNLTDRIVIPDNDSLDLANVTMTAWVKTGDSSGLWKRIFDKDWRKGYVLTIGGGTVERNLRGKLAGQAQGTETASPIRVADGNWHHVAATFNGDCNVLYVDGVEDKQAKISRYSHGTTPVISNNWDLCIGNSVVNYGLVGECDAFDGLIDEVRLYNRVLPADEIKALAATTQAGVVPTPAQQAPTNSSPSAPADRIKQIKQLLEQGLIDKQEYDRRVKEILDAI